jgi:hypothetical protein
MPHLQGLLKISREVLLTRRRRDGLSRGSTRREIRVQAVAVAAV